jgi:N-acetylmuramoyl-L-alanine amidase
MNQAMAGRLIPLIISVAAVMVNGAGWARAADPPRVTGIRIGTQEGITRLVLNLSGPIKYRAFELGPPYRVVVDMPKVEWIIAREMSFSASSPLAFLRFSANGPQVFRLLLEARRPMRVQKSFFMSPNERTRSWRIVIDLEPVSEDAFERIMRRRRAAAGPQGKKTNKARPDKKSSAKDPRPLVFIDPGHGGADPGAISKFGLKEKDIVLRFARRLRTEIKTDGRYRVAFSRTADFYVPLRRRYAMARKQGAKLFISIHADSNPAVKTSGLTAYTRSNVATDKGSAALARRENRSDAVAGVDLSGHPSGVTNILRDLVRRDTQRKSRTFARYVVREMKGVTRLAARPVRSARFAVLRAPDLPSVLLELGFLTNRRDSRRLVNDRHMRRVARAVAAAINRFFGHQPAASAGRK